MGAGMGNAVPVSSLLVLLALVAICFGQRAESDSDSPKVQKSRQLDLETQLVSRLFSGNYDRYLRPPVPGCTIRRPFFIICYLNDLDSSDLTSIVVVVNSYVNSVEWLDGGAKAEWEDGRLRYEVDPRESISELRLPPNKRIWRPDTFFSNAQESDSGRTEAFLEPSGYVRTSSQRLVTVPVSYGTKFPFSNTRKVTLRLGSYTYRIDDVLYMWGNSPPGIYPVEVKDDGGSYDGFTFDGAETEDCVGNYSVGQYACIEVTLTFAGSATEPLFRVFLPSLFLVVASWLHFWVHGSWSVPRTFSAALPFFIFAAILALYPQPRLSTSGISGLQVWILFCLIITFLSFLEYFVVICCGIRRTQIRYYQATGSEAEHPLTAAKEAVEEAYESRCANFKQNSGLDIICRILFPVIFIIFLVLYLLYYLL